jgi:serine/threonine protein phosphatase PrpC
LKAEIGHNRHSGRWKVVSVYRKGQELSLQIETADVSLIGHREENQDRVAVAAADQSVLLAVIDGMGGHAEGARAAETALATLLEAFWQIPHPVFDPLGFLHLSLGRAHEEVVKLGVGLSVEARPRATCAVCLVQDSAAYWAHVGDSRVYQLRQSRVLERTRDHSHVEVLLREGLITEAEVHGHPMRNYVECCLGGDAALPEMSISTRRRLKSGDVLLLCTDGVWANLRDPDFVRFAQSVGKPLRETLFDLGTQAVTASAPYSDNASAAALRWRAA